ncbi:MAG: ATP-binding protein, partial [Sphaerochaeta sp.]|nr:ATP-binding protein [Sphaerochaeta sp.]
NNAQLIFCTHNTGVMDTLGKYRVILVNKEENESFLYRLDELPGNIVRNDRSLETIYKTGKLGGTPNL